MSVPSMYFYHGKTWVSIWIHCHGSQENLYLALRNMTTVMLIEFKLYRPLLMPTMSVIELPILRGIYKKYIAKMQFGRLVKIQTH